jgi:poly(3-hydroxybutyrate) depolymerase
VTINYKMLLTWCALVALLPACSRASDVASKQVQCDAQKYHYVLFSPAKNGERDPLPAILLLHGAGDDPSNFLDAWKHFAGRNRIVLVAPELPREEKFEPVAPKVFRCVMDDAKQFASIDSRRVYVFGHSMGGYLGYDAAMFDSEYFAAVAIHAMFIADQYKSILANATRKTPIAIYSGDHDELVPIEKVRQTRDTDESRFPGPIHRTERPRPQLLRCQRFD